MDVYRVSFIGQGFVADEDAVRDLLEDFAARLIKEKPFVEFLVTRENRFDAIATSAVRRAQSVYGTKNSCLSLTLAQPIAKNDFFADYDNVVQPLARDETYDTVQNHRRTMIAQSDLVISYVPEHSGEAYHALKYAVKKNKTVKNVVPPLSEALDAGLREGLDLL